MSSLLLFLPTLLPSTHTRPPCTPPPSFPPQSCNKSRQALGFGLPWGGHRLYSDALHAAAGCQTKEIWMFFFLFFIMARFHTSVQLFSALLFLLSHPVSPSSRKQSKADLDFTICLSVEQYFLALNCLYHNSQMEVTTKTEVRCNLFPCLWEWRLLVSYLRLCSHNYQSLSDSHS